MEKWLLCIVKFKEVHFSFRHRVEEVTLIPYAVHDDVYDKYTKRIADIQKPWGNQKNQIQSDCSSNLEQ